MFRSLLGAAALFIASCQVAQSATYQIDFTAGAITGFLTFDSYADGPATPISLEMTSNIVGEIGTGYTLGVNRLYFSNGELLINTSQANDWTTFERTVDDVRHVVGFHPDLVRVHCYDNLVLNLDDPGRCNGLSSDFHRVFFDNEPFAFDNKISAVPLPAGLPLVLTGVAGLAILRRRKAESRLLS